MFENPLVSVIVITYNSSKYVLETLESIKVQSYKNIELIISDDCSTDETVDICKKWLDENHSFFIDTKIISVSKNTGISANCNRGVKKANGEWVKMIAGDDALYKDGIENLLKFALLNKAKVIHSDYESFMNSFMPEFINVRSKKYNYYMTSNLASAKEQHSFLLWNYNIVAPTVLINKELLCMVGLFDERIPMVEDQPMWLKLTEMGIKIFYLEKKTVKYRISENSVTERIIRTKVVSNSAYQFINILKYYLLPNVNFWIYVIIRYEMIRRYVVYNSVLNKLNFFNDYFDRITSLPFRRMVQVQQKKLMSNDNHKQHKYD